MTIRLSTALAKAIMDTGSFKAAMENAGDGFLIDIYSGPRPADPDTGANLSGQTKLVTISVGGAGTGLLFDATAPAGVLPKSTGQTWSGTILADGTAAWFRARLKTGDDGLSTSTTLKRFDGLVAVSGGDLTIESLGFVLGAPFSVASAAFTLPRGV